MGSSTGQRLRLLIATVAVTLAANTIACAAPSLGFSVPGAASRTTAR